MAHEAQLEPGTYQFFTQQALQRVIDPTQDPTSGPHGVVSYWLIPANGYVNGQRLPHAVAEDLKNAGFTTYTQEGVEYYLVPEASSNTPGRLSHYAQTTGVAELQNPPGGGVNRVRETFNSENTVGSVAPEAVAKYVEQNDAFEEARTKQSAVDEQLAAAITQSPAREPSKGDLVVGDESGDTHDTGGNDKKSASQKDSEGDSSSRRPARKDHSQSDKSQSQDKNQSQSDKNNS